MQDLPLLSETPPPSLFLFHLQLFPLLLLTRLLLRLDLTVPCHAEAAQLILLQSRQGMKWSHRLPLVTLVGVVPMVLLVLGWVLVTTMGKADS